MVDSIQGSGGARPSQNIQSISKTSSTKGDDRSEETSVSAPADEVRISDEALNLSQIEKMAGDLRAQLGHDTEISLGLDPNFDGAV